MQYIRFVLYLILYFSSFLAFLQAQESHLPREKKTILVTGAAGFIGSNFVTYMFDKYPEYHFIALDALTYAGSVEKIPEYITCSSRFEFIHDTINNETVVDAVMSRSNYVVHLAAETHVTRSIQNDFVFFNTDVMGTRVLMSALIKYTKNVERFIHISTSEVYGNAEIQPMDESHLLNARSPYAAAKVGADRLVHSYCCTFDVPAVIFRPFNNYGPNQHLEKLIPRLISSAIKGEPLTIHGTGQQKRDWVHALDTSKAIDAALHTADFASIKHQVINIGSGVATSVFDIAEMILKEFDLPASFLKFTEDRPGQVDVHISSTQKAIELLNWKATIPLEEGLYQTIQWYKNHPEMWEKMENDALIPIRTRAGKLVFQ